MRVSLLRVGQPYQYFPGKEAIAAALLEQHVAETIQLLIVLVANAGEKRPGMRDALREYVSSMVAGDEPDLTTSWRHNSGGRRDSASRT